ncbi:TRAP transporter small permease [Paracoccus aestuariivivens]|uniref:TRAP transporter small permease protein n=1 Tax=Paracoccus aestuariivivens TaxID=1820333 RepID=A0A6L6JCT6_9RHOB|nr:TRAP transporter small permease subunit [Paracoccus aestuariivivens]MTH80013.1 TRAP transporter small permease subunit [Paracoccus aestuariivivens]
MLSKILRQLTGVIGLLSLLLYFYQIVSSWLFHAWSIPWFAEVAVYAITWAMFLAVSELVAQDGHIRADFVISRLSVPAQRRCELINCGFGVGFSALMLWYGWLLTWDAWIWDDRSPTGIAFPLWIYYSCAPISGALMLYRYCIRLGQYLFAFNPTTMKLVSNEVM